MSYVEIWDPNEVLNLASKGALLVDVRANAAYDKEHIRGAINIPLDDLDSHLENLPKDKPVVVYCGSVDCTMSYFAARKLASKGFTVYRYTPGLKGWKEAGLPTEGLKVKA
jgi:rhodanese-related sulfurtransferase